MLVPVTFTITALIILFFMTIANFAIFRPIDLMESQHGKSFVYGLTLVIVKKIILVVCAIKYSGQRR